MAIGRIPEPGTGIPESIIAAKGDLIVGTANDTPGILSVGTNGHTLVADSSVSPTGLKWAVDPVADVVTTAGDLLYATAADTVTRLGIGTAGQVLKVNSGATAPEWGAAGGGDFVKISSVTWTAANAQSLTSVFSATYDNYCIVLDNLQGSNTNDLCIRMRSGANNDTNSTYYWANLGLGTNNTGYNSNSNGTDTFRTQGLAETPHKTGFIMWMFNPFESVRTSAVWTQMGATSTEFAYNTGGGVFAADTSFDGLGFFLFAGGDLSGDATVYGLKK